MLTRCLAALIVLAACEPALAAAEVPPCAGGIEVPRARVIRVERNGVLVLQDGRAVHAEGILLPAGARDHAPDFLAQQALAELRALAVGQTVMLAALSPKEDRYDRLRAEVFLPDNPTDRWLQVAMLGRGLARVSVAPDRRECAAELYASEERARGMRLGIWSAAAYGVRTPAQLAGDISTFQIVEGNVASVTSNGGRVFLDFTRGKGLALTISSGDLKAFREIGVDPYSYSGLTIRARGWIEQFDRPEMEIAIPEDIEVVAMPALRSTTADKGTR